MLSIHYLLFYLFLIIILALASKPTYRPKQCLRYRDNDMFLDTCPAYLQGTMDFSAALFPDPAVISGLSKPNIKEKHNLDQESPSKSPISSITETVQSLPHSDEPHITKQDDDNTNNINNNNDKSNNNNNDNQPPPPSEDQHEEEGEEKRKPLVSFEEWQKKALQENEKDRRHKRKIAEEGHTTDNRGNKRQQMVDSIDGGFSDDFGSMFEDLIGGVVGKEKTPNVYDEGEYIAPSKQGDGNNNKDKKLQQYAAVRMKSLKERFNYASTDCAATVRKANKQAKGAQSILYESKDQYLLNKCAADKFVIINLCEEIVVDTLVMANFEFFSSTFKDFRVYASSKYPTKDWRLLGQWQARNTRDLQVFKVPSGFVEYMKIEFLTHYGHEYYCPLSLVRVHGMSMMEYYTTVESQDDDPIIEDEHLWPAEVREQLIQPQFDVTNTSESFPIKNDVDEEDIKPMIPPINFDTVIIEPKPMPTIEVSESDFEPTTKSVEHLPVVKETILNELNVDMETEVSSHATEGMTTNPASTVVIDQEISDTVSTSQPSFSSSVDTSSSVDSLSSDETNGKEAEHLIDTLSSVSISPSSKLASSTSSSSVSPSSDNKSSTIISSTIDSINQNVNSTTHASTIPSTTIVSSSTTEESRPIFPPPPPHPQKIVTPNLYPKEGSTQESIYKTIMKRLNVLEVNLTLSQRYLDDQNKNLNDVLKDMEKKHQDQLILLIGHLNETASHRIDSMKRRYEQWYEDLKDQTDSDMREMTAKISILADQLSFERRVSVSQLVIMITLFVFMALSRGTFSTLSPVMAAQQEVRKRRESIDQSSTLSKEAMDILLKPNNGAGTTAVSTATTTTSNTVKTNTTSTVDEVKLPKIISETPKKPSNPRRHTDNHYHTMSESDLQTIVTKSRSRGSSNATNENNTPPLKNISRNISYESLGIELQNEVLQRKLSELQQQQQLTEEQTLQEVPLLTNASRKASLDNLKKQDENSIKNRKRSSTSPSSIE